MSAAMDLARLADQRRGLAVIFAVLGNVLPIAVATLFDLGSHPTAFFVGAAGASIVPVIVTALPSRYPAVTVAAALAGIPCLTLMQAETGGVASGYAVLALMAMIYFGVYAGGRELIAGLAMFVACAFGPMLVVGAPAYPVSWGHALVLVLVGVSVAGSLRALTGEMRRLNVRLREDAILDELTGLLNRRGWKEAAGDALARAKRSESPVCLALLDLDGFKHVNDQLGHDEGDRVLQGTAERMRSVLRATDVLARLGGDEFVLLLGDSDAAHTFEALARLRQTTPPNGAFSAGVACWDRRESLDELVRRADLGLYAAKADGGGAAAPGPDRLELEVQQA